MDLFESIELCIQLPVNPVSCCGVLARERNRGGSVALGCRSSVACWWRSCCEIPVGSSDCIHREVSKSLSFRYSSGERRELASGGWGMILYAAVASAGDGGLLINRAVVDLFFIR